MAFRVIYYCYKLEVLISGGYYTLIAGSYILHTFSAAKKVFHVYISGTYQIYPVTKK